MYITEEDVAFLVLNSILAALTPFDFSGEVTIKPDICAILLHFGGIIYLVGVVEVKKPGLLQPAVLGELLADFYGMVPVIGILTTTRLDIVKEFRPVDCSLQWYWI